jgi:serine/threonine protein phosphatase PrpC
MSIRSDKTISRENEQMSTYQFVSLPGNASLRVALPLLGVILMALQLLLPAGAYASAASGSFSFGTSKPLDEAGVSVVRLAASYNPVPPASGCSGASLTGLGALVGSWNTTGNTQDFTSWILTDGALVNPKGMACGSAGKKTARLTSIQVFVNSAFNAGSENHVLVTLDCRARAGTCALNGGTSPETLTCQIGSDCTQGVVLIPFHTRAPLPFVQVAPAEQTTPPPNGIELTGAATTPPAAAQAGAALTPTQAILAGAQNEPGMPIVNASGQLQGMNLHALDPQGSILSYVNTTLQPLQNNPLQSNWATGVADYYAQNYPAARQALQLAAFPNNQFKAPAAFLGLQAFNRARDAASSVSSAGTHTSPTRAQSVTDVLGLAIPSTQLMWYMLGGVLVLVILLVFFSLILVRRQARHRRELARFEAETLRVSAKADIDAQRLALQETQQRQGPGPRHTLALGGPPPASQPTLVCPNCATAVNPGDRFCTHCRMPLVLSDSGLNVRLAKPAAAMPPEAPPAPPGRPAPAGTIYEQPTIEMSPDQPGNGQADTAPAAPFKPQAPLEPYIGHKLSLVVGTRSNPGIKRKHKPNEDSLFAAQGERTLNSNAEQFGLFVVADGMGGHANGQDASRLAIQTIVERLMPKLSSSDHYNDDGYIQLLVEGVQEANLAVHQRNVEHRADMGTTMTAALVVGITAYVANVGDSRTYLYREPVGLKKVTNDHSVVASLVEAGIIKPDDIYTHPKRNQIYRSLGEKPVIDVDSFTVPLQVGDKLLLCSDGLWDMVRDPTIQNVLRSVPDPTQTGNALIKAALDGGGEDNVSVIVVSVNETSSRTGMTGVQLLARPDAPQYPPIQ